MANKANYQKAQDLYHDVLSGIKENPDELKKILDTGSSLYRYRFDEQAVISQYKPDAKACATYDQWNRIGDYVRRGSKGIPLPQPEGGLKYVFDVSDIGMTAKGRMPYQWRATEENSENVVKALEQASGFDLSKNTYSFEDKILAYCNKVGMDIAEEMLQELSGQGSLTADEYFTGLSEEEQAKAASGVISSVMAYSMFKRLDISTDYAEATKQIDFDLLKHFDIKGIASLCGIATQHSGEALDIAAKEIIRLDRMEEKNHARNDLSQRRGLSASRHESRYGERGNQALGAGEDSLRPEILQRGLSGRQNDEWGMVSGSAGSSGRSRGNGEALGGKTEKETQSDRTDESRESDGVDTLNAANPGRSRGDHHAGSHLQISGYQKEDAAVPSEMEQIGSIIVGMAKDGDLPPLVKKALDTVISAIPSDAKALFSAFFDMNSSQEERKEFVTDKMADVPVIGKGSDGIEISKDNEQLRLSFDDVTGIIGAQIEQKEITASKESKEALKESILAEAHEKEAEEVRAFMGECSERLDAVMGKPVESMQNNILIKYGFFGDSENPERLENPKQDITLSLVFEDAEGTKKADRIQGIDDIRAKIGAFSPETEREETAEAPLPPENPEEGQPEETEKIVQPAQDNPQDVSGKVMQDAQKEEAEQLQSSEKTSVKARDLQVGDKIHFRDQDYTVTGTSLFIIRLTDAEGHSHTRPPFSIDKIGFEKLETSAPEEKKEEPEISGEKEEITRQAEETLRDSNREHPESDTEKETLSVEIPPEEDVSLLSVPEKEKKWDFAITDDALGTGTPKEKYRKNIDAITLLKELEKENRPASGEEKEILSQYTGWGGLSEVFDEHKGNWSNEFQELKGLLTDEEYSAARSSTLTSFYSSPMIIEQIYDKLSDMGFQEGKLLEPSCGVGNFIGKIPEAIRNDVSVTGIELDSLSGRIAAKIYPEADIQIKGFEETKFHNNTFDVAVGNIPFGDFKLSEKEYDKDKLLIHDHFFVKSLDKVKPNGIVAFITSKGTLDKQDSHARELMAEKADFLGAVRLPNNAFKENAGTEVTADIIFLQKRETSGRAEDASWVHVGRDENGILMNQYFATHPEMICGHMENVMGRFGYETACISEEAKPLKEYLKEALGRIEGHIDTERNMPTTEEQLYSDSISTEADARNFSFVIGEDDRIYFKEDSDEAVLQDVGKKPAERIKGLCGLRDKAYELLDMQLSPTVTDSQISAAQKELKALYDDFVKDNGRINTAGNSRAFSMDESWGLLCSLEVLDDDGDFVRLADIFNKRTVEPYKEADHADNAKDALILSLNNTAGVDLEYMAALCGSTVGEVKEELIGRDIFQNPKTGNYETADEYLSGNVREKLREAEKAAEEHPSLYASNVEALKKSQPKDLTADDIEVRLGSSWIPPDVIVDFCKEKLDVKASYFYESEYKKPDIKIEYDAKTSEWNIKGKNVCRNIKCMDMYGNKDYGINAMKVLEQSLNLRDVKVTYVDKEGKRHVDPKATAEMMSKQDAMKALFKDWVFDDFERRERLVSRYNEQFNSIKTREYDGSQMDFRGMNPNITLKPHQKDAVARQVYGGNTLLAHCVGAGKTFEMAAAAMEMKRTGVSKKPLFVVPKPLVGQWAKEFKTLYPTSKVLAASEKDFTPANRKKFISRIATGDYDAVIVSHSQFAKIPLSNEYMIKNTQKEIDETMEFLEREKEEKGQNFSVKQAESTLKKLKKRMETLTDMPHDSTVTFEQMGVDHLFVDESHMFKNLPFHTKMQVSGISASDNKSCTDMLCKCNYINEITNNKGITFATGTPVSNSMSEIFANMKYLQPDILQSMNCEHFDDWASNFGSTVTAVEFDINNNFHQKTRFAEFFNLPELMSAFKQAADVQTPDMLDLDVPERVNKHIVEIEPSDLQKQFVKSFAERAERCRNGLVNPKEDNMLKITTDGRKLALDQRFLAPDAEENANSKVKRCAEKAFEIYQKHPEAAQMIFSDIGTPNDEGRLSVYDDLKNLLIEKGVPAEQIALIHDYDSDKGKEEVQRGMNNGSIRFLIGSTGKCGTGLNVQKHLKALHHLDVPWRPSDIEQREGRIIRQGNENPDVDIYRYVTKGTFDTYSWQLIEQKQKFVGQIMTSKEPVRSIQDVDANALEYAEIKALASGNPLLMDKANLERDVNKLKLDKATFKSGIRAAETKLYRTLPTEIEAVKKYIIDQRADQRALKAHDYDINDKDAFKITVNDKIYTDKKEGGQALIDYVKRSAPSHNGLSCGEFKGFKIDMHYEFATQTYSVSLRGKGAYPVLLGDDGIGMVTRLNNALQKGIPKAIERLENKLSELETDVETAKEEVEKPFPKEAELAEKEKQLAEINYQLEHADDAPAPDAVAAPEKTVQEVQEKASSASIRNEGRKETSITNARQDKKLVDLRNFLLDKSDTGYQVRADILNPEGKAERKGQAVFSSQSKEDCVAFLKKNGVTEYQDKSTSLASRLASKQKEMQKKGGDDISTPSVKKAGIGE